MNKEGLLPRDAQRRTAIQHLKVVDTVESGIAENRGFAVIVAAEVDHELPPKTKVCTSVTSVLTRA